jgi:hypothetical protein
MVKSIPLLILLFAVSTACNSSESFVQSKSDQKQPENLLTSSTCDLPCVFGVTVGQTLYEEALKIIAERPDANTISVDGQFWIAGESNRQLFVTVKRFLPAEDDTVPSVELSTHSSKPILPIGELMNSGLTPIKVFRNRVSGGPNTENLLLVLGEHQQIFAVVVVTESLNADSPITDLVLVDSQKSGWILDDIRTIWHFDDEIAWLGFAPVDDYLTTPKLWYKAKSQLETI